MLLKIYIISQIFTIWYAWSRSMHDKHLFGTKDYKWHWWALNEAITLNSVFMLGLWFIFNDQLVLVLNPVIKLIALWLANAFLFWIIFDMLMGWHGKRDIWYIGITGFDLHVRKIFMYNVGNIRGKMFFVIKLLWYIIIVLGIYFQVNINNLLQ